MESFDTEGLDSGSTRHSGGWDPAEPESKGLHESECPREILPGPFLPHSGHCDPGLTSRQATKGSLWRGPAQEARTRDLDLPSLSLSLHFSYGIGPVLFRLCPQVASILVGEREKETNKFIRIKEGLQRKRNQCKAERGALL